MQVQKIQGTSGKNNLNFRYNPTVNAELIKTLENGKKNKVFNNYLKNLVNATNKAEVDLRIAEKNNKKQLAELLFAAFVPAKILITDMIDALFPETNYREKELVSYSEEMMTTGLAVTVTLATLDIADWQAGASAVALTV